ncbi:hypothetical protein GBAR_LOCUS31614 [Geodia barretti]|uniref:Uncharacterized protein n=1 Tax=Geodia barretti TaxID=519541 RepID=A0AA35U294_GEOBA|nr:hypothetical protein GBAR_LOCUS31614 [Geodia barretti]
MPRCTSATTSGARDRGAIVPVAVIRKTSFLVIGLAAVVASDLSDTYHLWTVQVTTSSWQPCSTELLSWTLPFSSLVRFSLPHFQGAFNSYYLTPFPPADNESSYFNAFPSSWQGVT